MKNNVFKKVLAVVLSIAIVAVMPCSVLAAASNADPLIYIADINESALYNTKTGEAVLGQNTASFLAPVTHIATGILLYDSELGSPETGSQLIKKGVNSMFSSIICDEKGESVAANIAAWDYSLPLSYYTDDDIYTENLSALFSYSNGAVTDSNTYAFTYDWRLDPGVAAEELVDFIEHVKTQTGSKKVDIIAAGYGGIVANTYLYYYGEHAASSVDSFVFLNADILGNSIMGDLFKGELYQTILDQESFMNMYAVITSSYRGEALVNYLQQDPNGILRSLLETVLGESTYVNAIGYMIATLVAYILNQEDIGNGFGESYNKILVDCADDIYEEGLKDYLRYMPGLWAYVPEDDYDEAMDFMFGDEIIDSDLLSKIRDYREVLAATQETLNSAQECGIKMNIVAGYNVQIMPLTATVDESSDGISSVKYASAGASTVDKNDIWEKSDVCTMKNHNHMSPDLDIDASTCFLPENTWFIRNLPHMNFTGETAAKFLTWLITADEQLTVWQNFDYPQYLSYLSVTEKISAYSDNSENVDLSDLRKGDVNRDGNINAADARLALRYSVGLEGSVNKVVLFLADVVGNDGVKAADARYILRYAVGLETTI